MALLPDVFTPDDVEVDSCIPAGWYEAEIIGSKLKKTKNFKDTGNQYIELKFKILDEAYEGRLVFTNLNIKNTNATAVRIANQDLKRICEACDIDGVLEDTEDLHEIPMMIKLSVKPETSEWPEKNEIKGFKGIRTDDDED